MGSWQWRNIEEINAIYSLINTNFDYLFKILVAKLE